MANPCVVAYCINIGTHRFPRNETIKSQWIQAITHIKPGFIIREYSVICSAHFRQTDFARTAVTPALGRARKILKKNAIPSVFPWNRAPREEPSLIFDPSKVQATYSRTPPIVFVEEQPFLDTAASDVEDPLEYSNEKPESLFEELKDPLEYCNEESESLVVEIKPDDDNIIEIELSTADNDAGELLQETLLHVTEQQHDKSVQPVDAQTQDDSICGFSVYYYKDDNKSLHFYTGLENFKKIKLVFYSLGKSVHNLKYFYGRPPQKIDALEQFYITLIILRRHKTFEEMSMLYKITLKQICTIFITWIRFMSLQWKTLDLWVDREKVRAYMPLDFNDKNPATRTVLNATECPIKKPKLPLAQQVTFSSNKNRNTIKVLIGITPGGLINYVSPSYGGSATDRQLIERSSILNKFEHNDEILVDKGLNVQDIFKSYGVKVNMPAFFRKGNQIESNQKVASKRVHVERVISMLKTYKILTEPMNQTETLLSSDIVFVCAMLVNFRSNIINKNA